MLHPSPNHGLFHATLSVTAQTYDPDARTEFLTCQRTFWGRKSNLAHLTSSSRLRPSLVTDQDYI